MKNLVLTQAKLIEKEKTLQDYYEELFGHFKSTDLFEVYDLNKEIFVQFPGREGSQVINRETLISNLVQIEAYNEPLEHLVVLRYDQKDTNFQNPVFVGKHDSYTHQKHWS